MLASPTTTATSRRALRNAALTVLLGGTACSLLPPTGTPPHADWSFRAGYVIDQTGRLPFPVTTRELVVRDLQLDPAPLGEGFADGARWFVYPAGTAVDVHGVLRIYQRHDGSQPSLADVLPDADLRAAR